MIKKASWAQPAKKAYQSPNPILQMVPIKKKKKPVQVLLEVRKTPVQPKFKQYGDKGYRPSSGKGVGY